jgi:hypothetical protein
MSYLNVTKVYTMITQKLAHIEIVNAALRSVPEWGFVLLISQDGFWPMNIEKFTLEFIPNLNVLLSTGELRLVVPFYGSYLPVKEASRVTDSLGELLILTIEGLEGETVHVIPLRKEGVT